MSKSHTWTFGCRTCYQENSDAVLIDLDQSTSVDKLANMCINEKKHGDAEANNHS